MRDFFKRQLNRLIEWMDLPPSPTRPDTAEVYWEFLGDLLGELGALTPQEIQNFSEREFYSIENIDSLIQTWVLPTFARLTSTSQIKIIHCLDFYLNQCPEKLSWIIPSFAIPIQTNAFTLFSRIRQLLPLENTIDGFRAVKYYHENNRRAFTNTLFAYLHADSSTLNDIKLPLRKGFILPNAIYESCRYDTQLITLASRAKGISLSNAKQPLAFDSVRWLPKIDLDNILNTAATRLLSQKNEPFGITRLTMTYRHAVGEGYLAGHPDTLCLARKVRVIIDRLGFIVRCYPVLRN